jgi:hypothetical protein
MKRLLITVFFALSAVAQIARPTYSGHGSYSGYRSWIIEHSITNQVPTDERIFVATPPPAPLALPSPRAFVAIIRYHEGSTIGTLIDQTPFLWQGCICHGVAQRDIKYGILWEDGESW